MRAAAILFAGLLLGGAAGSGEVRFAAAPKAIKAGRSIRITFAASAPTDVEVAILDARGAVVRHLAAGLLGKGAPEPLKREDPFGPLTHEGVESRKI